MAETMTDAERIGQLVGRWLIAAGKNFPKATCFPCQAADVGQIETLLKAAGMRWKTSEHLGNWSVTILGSVAQKRP